jgi:hypothetical protein
MKIKCVKLGNSQQKSMVLLVKSPQYICKEVLLGDHIEVDDPVGHVIMTQYPGIFEVVHYGEKPAAAEGGKKQKVVESWEKQ